MCGVTFVPGETAGSSVFPSSAMLSPNPSLILTNPLGQPDNFTLYLVNSGSFYMLPRLQKQEMVSAFVAGAVVMNLSRVLRDDVVAPNWL